MTVNKKTGRLVKPKSLTQKMKAAATRKHNRLIGKTKPIKKKK
jgi:hypothetical protein